MPGAPVLGLTFERNFRVRNDHPHPEKNGYVTATKLGAANKIFVAATKNFAGATKRLVDRTEHFVVTKHFCYPYFNK